MKKNESRINLLVYEFKDYKNKGKLGGKLCQKLV